MEKEDRKEKAWSYLRLAIGAYLGLFMEGIVTLIEYIIYHKEMNEYSTYEIVMHWIITCAIWGCFTYLLYLVSKRKGFDLMKNRTRPDKKGLIIAILLTIICIIEMAISFGGFKPLMEMRNKSGIRFIFQYLYYLFEVALFFEVLAFGQKFGEKHFRHSNIPYGGCVLALTWGMIHFLTKNYVTGIESIAFSFVFGIIYLCVNKNTKLSYFFLACAFLL